MATAAIEATDEVNALAVKEAINTVHTVYFVLQGSLRFEEAERVSPTLVAGRWGSYDVNYALNEELLHPFMRPAADKYNPTLGKRLAKRLEGKLN